MSLNIASKAATETAVITIIDPETSEQLVNDNREPCSVTVYGPSSKPYLAAQAAHNAKNIKRFRAKGKAETSPEEDIADKAAFLSAITISFDGFDYNGKADKAAFHACYSDPGLGWLTNQVNAGAGDWSNFTPDSSAT
jgi:hypothetical protein